MKISSKGLELIKEAEGFSSVAYLCPAGIRTIGYGNTFYEDGRKVKLGEQISKTKAEELLEFVVNKYFADKVFPLIKVEVNQNQFDALLSLAYNIGFEAFTSSTFLKKLNQGDFIGASEEFLRWDKSKGQRLLGLTRRRQREKELFLR